MRIAKSNFVFLILSGNKYIALSSFFREPLRARVLFFRISDISILPLKRQRAAVLLLNLIKK